MTTRLVDVADFTFAVTPFMVTILLAGDGLKFVPVIVTSVFDPPRDVLNEEIVLAGGGGTGFGL